MKQNLASQAKYVFIILFSKQVRVVSGVIPLYLRVKAIFPMQLLSNIDMRDIPFLFKIRSGGGIGRRTNLDKWVQTSLLEAVKHCAV